MYQVTPLGPQGERVLVPKREAYGLSLAFAAPWSDSWMFARVSFMSIPWPSAAFAMSSIVMSEGL